MEFGSRGTDGFPRWTALRGHLNFRRCHEDRLATKRGNKLDLRRFLRSRLVRRVEIDARGRKRMKRLFTYSFHSTGTASKPNCTCELQVDGYTYTAVGNAAGKKGAKIDALRNFCVHLVQSGAMRLDELPAGSLSAELSHCAAPTQAMSHLSQSFARPPQKATVLTIYTGTKPYRGTALRELQVDQVPTYDLAADKEMWEDAEAADINAEIHGNWALENAKCHLNHFLQKNKIEASYTYFEIGIGHKRSFAAEMSFYVTQCDRKLSAHAYGSSESLASKNCALSLVRQLYHLNVIEAFTAIKKQDMPPLPDEPMQSNSMIVNRQLEALDRSPRYRGAAMSWCPQADRNRSALCLINKTSSQQINWNFPMEYPLVAVSKLWQKMPPYELGIDPELEQHIWDVLYEFGINPIYPAETRHPFSLVVNQQLETFYNSPPYSAEAVSWCPPRGDWNPWASCFLGGTSSEEMSCSLLSEFQILTARNAWQKMLNQRKTLPVYEHRDAVLEAIEYNQVVLLRGPTGSGKTTQVPQYILDYYISHGRGAECNVIVTQPRRLSAVSVAERVAQERCEHIGITAGYSVRFETVLPRTHGAILYCTVGTLIRKLENGLKGVSHIIVDEIHERSVNTDFILIVLRDMVRTYPDLRIVLMSAAVDVSMFREYFGDVKTIEIQGRVHPIQEYYLEDCVEMLHFVPLQTSKKPGDVDLLLDGDKQENCLLNVDNKYSESTLRALAMLSEEDVPFDLIEALIGHISGLKIPGAILIFLTGWSIISKLMHRLLGHPVFGSSRYVIYPLHSQVSREDQNRIFFPVPPGVTKIILSTNIAESSITIDDVVFVIDSCRVKIKLFTSHNNMINYTTTWASRSNLEQRRGRAGRVRPGFCFHLCTRTRFERLEQHITPEILRTQLHEPALAIKLLRLGSIRHFLLRAMQPPPLDAIVEAEVLLREMKALNSNDELTPLGRLLARMPVEPRLGKMLIYGCIFGCGDALCTIVASTTTPEPFEGLADHKRMRDAHALLAARCSDHVTLLNAFCSWERVRDWKDHRAQRAFCESRCLSAYSLQLISKAKKQLRNILVDAGFPPECFSPVEYSFHGYDSTLDMVTALLGLGMYPNICYHTDKHRVLTAEMKAAVMHQTSVNCCFRDCTFASPFFVFREKIRTRSVSCKQATMVTPLPLLLFACKSVVVDGEIVVLDNWIPLKMPVRTASLIVALRPVLEALIVRVTTNPACLVSLNSPRDLKLLRVVQDLATPDAAIVHVRHWASSATQDSSISNRPRHGGGAPPASKYPRWLSNVRYCDAGSDHPSTT